MSGGDRPGYVIDVQLLGLNDTYIATWSPPSLTCEKEGKNLSLAAACVRVCVVGPQVAARDPSFDAPYSYTL